MTRSHDIVLTLSCITYIQYMDFDYHDSFRRLAVAYKEAEKETGEAMLQSADTLVDQTKSLNFENDLHYFLSEFSQTFTPPNEFQFGNFEGDDVKKSCDNHVTWCHSHIMYMYMCR